MAENIEEESLDNLANVRPEESSEEIAPIKETEAINPRRNKRKTNKGEETTPRLSRNWWLPTAVKRFVPL